MTIDPALWPTPVPVAHRGSRLLWPENTMVGFNAAFEMGYRHLETDLHITSDGVLVCVHDDTVDRTTDGTGDVASFTFDELGALDAGYRHATRDGFAFRGKGIQIPAFEDVLAAFPDVSFVLDMKVDGVTGPLAKLIDSHQIHDRLLVGAFSDDRLEVFRAATEGKVPTSTGPMLSRLWVLSSRVGRGAGGSASALQVPTQIRGVRVVDERLVAAAHDAGLHVHVWTVNDVDEMERLLDMGVDGLVSDRPDLLRSLLLSRGDWRGR